VFALHTPGFLDCKSIKPVCEHRFRSSTRSALALSFSIFALG